MSGGHIPKDETMIQCAFASCTTPYLLINSSSQGAEDMRCHSPANASSHLLEEDRRGCPLVPGTAEDDADNPDFHPLPTLRLTSNIYAPKECTPPTPSVRQQSGRPNLQYIVGDGGAQLQMES